MKLYDLYKVSPWASIFIVERDSDCNIKERHEYNGTYDIANRQVVRINAAKYPMYASVLEVEIN